jgi:crotonobetainyl-CoA:carnitine CoA-transferase CaiB-like acyl-CoA transferase
VVKIEPPGTGESGRGGAPKIRDRSGRETGPTFLRYGLNKKSVAIDLRNAKGQALVRRLAPHFDVFCENMGPGRVRRYGLDYERIAEVAPRMIYLSVSGFGNLDPSPYVQWPAYAAVAEAMSGAYEYSRRRDQSAIVNPLGGVGDTLPGVYGVVGVLAALRHRDRIGRGQYVDISMFDAMLALADHITSFWSLGLRREPDRKPRQPMVMESFRARDGYFVLQISRPHQFERVAKLIGRAEWLEDERFATQFGWYDHLDDVLRPGIEAWAASRTKFDAAQEMAAAGCVAGPCYSPEDVVRDPHVELHRMLVEVPRADGVEQPILVHGNPVKMSCVAEGPDTDFPTLGEDTDRELTTTLGLKAEEIAQLRAEGVVG